MPDSKCVGGFDLILGTYYNDGWYNRASPEHNSALCCKKCNTAVTIHRLQKHIFAFGKIITKSCSITTCPTCLDEVVSASYIKSKKPVTKPNLTKLFSKLPKSIQQQLLMAHKD